MYDVVVIGAGVVGSSVARELSRYSLEVAVLEAKADVATGSTGANSAIVHAGYDCKPGTLMAKLNVAGNHLYDTVKEELDVPFERIGSLVVAFNDEDIRELEVLLNQGRQNGVPGLEIIPGSEVMAMEPNLNPEIKAALWAPTGGITCPYELTVALMENAVDNGVKVYLNHSVTSIEKQSNDCYIISTPFKTFKSRYIINCAGLYADELSRMVGAEEFYIRPRKGEYCLYDRKWGTMVGRVIFQPPSKMGKGILVTPTVDGNLLIGPNAVDIDQKDDTSTSYKGIETVYKTAIKSVPGLPGGGVIRQFAGLRAIGNTGDFIIKASERAKGFVHVAGICSPGLSAAPAIAKEVVDILISLEGIISKKKDFNPYRKGIPRFRDMDWNQRKKFIEENPAYGRVVCRCESVTEGEIVASLKRNLPVSTLDAVKRRTRAGMGRCQGGFCTPRVMEIMERELKVPMDEITKFGGKSRIVMGTIKNLPGGGLGK